MATPATARTGTMATSNRTTSVLIETRIEEEEREMLQSYEERSRRLEQAKDKSRQETKRKAAEKASKENQRLRCDYYRKRQENYEDRLRGGYTREQQLKLEENLARAKMQTGIYCR